jgi:glycosyltransferase involved in cell wall biosynthesis
MRSRLKRGLSATLGPLTGLLREKPARGPEAALAGGGPPGVNLIGLLDRPLGTGESARAAARALEAAGIPVHRVPVTEGDIFGGPLAPERRRRGPYAINLCDTNADATPPCVEAFGPEFFAGRFNIGYWVWEMEYFPHLWDGSYRYCDEIWVPSSFAQRSISERCPVPVLVMPHSIQVGPPEKDYRQQFGIPPDRKAFLCMFDLASFFGRKNPIASIRAFKKACAGRGDAMVVVKVGNAEVHPEALGLLREELAGAPSLLIDGWLGREEAWGLIAACDGVISLHRAEGFGLVCAEAMALGKPVVATGYSGNMDFMSPANSFPVDYTLVRLAEDVGPYPAGAEWADPDVEHAAALVRVVLDQPARARAVGERARQDVARQLCPAAVGRRMRNRLEALGLKMPG